LDSTRHKHRKKKEGDLHDYDMCVCGHVRFWHYGKCLMVTLDYEDHISTEYGFCGCAEFRLVKKESDSAKKKVRKKVPIADIT
jgi:hypothetical protein